MARKKKEEPLVLQTMDEREASMDFLSYVDDVRTGKRPPPMSTGLPALDRIMYGLIGGLNIVVGGRPGMGKTTLMVQLARNICSQDSKNCVLFNCLEMSPQQNAARTLAGITGVKFGKMIRGEVSEDEMSKLWATADSFPGGQFFLEPSIMTANQFHEHVVKLKEKVQADGKTLRAVFLDYVQLMADYAGSREQNISNISRTCKAVAHETGVVMVVGSQLNRELERREDKRPILADLRESGSLEQDADQVLMVYRPAVYYASAPEEDAELIVRKNRWGESGVAEVGWNGKGARFENLSPTSSHRESMQH